jgi:hypothetical protein
MILSLLLSCVGPDEGSDTGTDPTFARVQEEVFTPSCAFSTCHASPGASGLVLDEGKSHASLVEVESADSPGRTLVIAGDSDASYLIAKMRGDPDIVGELMPLTGGALEAERLQLVMDWIDAGATED